MAKKVQAIQTIADVSTQEIREDIFTELKAKMIPLDTINEYPMIWIWHGVKFVLREGGSMSLYDTGTELIDQEGKRTYGVISNKWILKLILKSIKEYRP